MQSPSVLSIFNRVHTAIHSSVDTLIYRNGKIEAHLQLPPEHQEEFEKRVEFLKLQLHGTLKAAQDDYQKELRKLFVEFGQIAKEPPLDLTLVESKLYQTQAAE